MPAPLTAVPAPAVAPNAPTQTPATIAAPAAKVDAAPEQFFEVKVNGQAKKYTRAEAERLLSKAGFADDVIRQGKGALETAAKLKAEMAERDSIWDDEERLEAELEKRGKLDALARKRLAKKIAEQEMTPEQRAIAERDAKIADLEKANGEAKAEKEKQQLAEQSKRIQTRVENELDAAWTRAGFERGADSFYAVYDVMREWKEIGLLPKGDDFSAAHADRIIEAARDSIEGGFNRLRQAATKGLKGAALVDRLGPDVVKEVLRFKAEELRGGGPRKAGIPPVAKKPDAAPEYLSPSEALKKMRGLG